MPGWIGPLALIVAAGIAVVAVWRAGRKAERGEAAEKTAEVNDAQLDAANQPRDPRSVSDELRRGDF